MVHIDEQLHSIAIMKAVALYAKILDTLRSIGIDEDSSAEQWQTQQKSAHPCDPRSKAVRP